MATLRSEIRLEVIVPWRVKAVLGLLHAWAWCGGSVDPEAVAEWAGRHIIVREIR